MGNTSKNQPQTSTSTSSLPPQISADYQGLVNRATGVANTPYQPYQGEGVAPLTPQTLTGLNQVNNTSQEAQPYLSAAGNLTTSALGNLQSGISNNLSTVNPQIESTIGNVNSGVNSAVGQGSSLIQQGAAPVGATPWSGSAIQQYMNPYTQSVINATQGEFNNQNQQQAQFLNSANISSGAFGGDRAGIGQSILANQQNLAQAPVIAGLNQANYGQATQEFNTQQATNLAAGQFNDQQALAAGQGLGNLGISGASTAGQLGLSGLGTMGNLGLSSAYDLGSLGLTGASNYGNIGTAAQTAGLQGGSAETQAGLVPQAQQQSIDQYLQNLYSQSQGYPFQTTGWLGNLLMGVGGQSGGASTTTSPPPSATSQGVGLATAGLGALTSYLSDERAKENIKPVGKTFDNQTIYRYNFKGDPRTQIGLIAQQAEKKFPHAVHEAGLGGLKLLDYRAATDKAAARGHFQIGGVAQAPPQPGSSGLSPRDILAMTGDAGAQTGMSRQDIARAAYSPTALSMPNQGQGSSAGQPGWVQDPRIGYASGGSPVSYPLSPDAYIDFGAPTAIGTGVGTPPPLAGLAAAADFSASAGSGSGQSGGYNPGGVLTPNQPTPGPTIAWQPQMYQGYGIGSGPWGGGGAPSGNLASVSGGSVTNPTTPAATPAAVSAPTAAASSAPNLGNVGSLDSSGFLSAGYYQPGSSVAHSGTTRTAFNSGGMIGQMGFHNAMGYTPQGHGLTGMSAGGEGLGSIATAKQGAGEFGNLFGRGGFATGGTTNPISSIQTNPLDPWGDPVIFIPPSSSKIGGGMRIPAPPQPQSQSSQMPTSTQEQNLGAALGKIGQQVGAMSDPLSSLDSLSGSGSVDDQLDNLTSLMAAGGRARRHFDGGGDTGGDSGDSSGDAAAAAATGDGMGGPGSAGEAASVGASTVGGFSGPTGVGTGMGGPGSEGEAASVGASAMGGFSGPAFGGADASAAGFGGLGGVSDAGSPSAIGPGGSIGPGVSTAGVTGSAGSGPSGSDATSGLGGVPGPSGLGGLANAFGSNVSQPGGATTNAVTALNSADQVGLNAAAGLHTAPGFNTGFANSLGNPALSSALSSISPAQLASLRAALAAEGGISGVGLGGLSQFGQSISPAQFAAMHGYTGGGIGSDAVAGAAPATAPATAPVANPFALGYPASNPTIGINGIQGTPAPYGASPTQGAPLGFGFSSAPSVSPALGVPPGMSGMTGFAPAPGFSTGYANTVAPGGTTGRGGAVSPSVVAGAQGHGTGAGLATGGAARRHFDAGGPTFDPSSIPDDRTQTTPAQRAAFIQNYAASKGYNVANAMGVAGSEGLNAPGVAPSKVDVDANGKPFSFQDFQLNTRNGMGADAQKAGIDPTSPTQWKQSDMYAMDRMNSGGLGPWKGDAYVRGIAGGSGASPGAIPPTAIAQVTGQTPQQSPTWQDRLHDLGPSLMQAGFGMMAARSPWALTNIGQGGMAGMEFYQKQRELDRQWALTNAQVQNAKSESAFRDASTGLMNIEVQKAKALLPYWQQGVQGMPAPGSSNSVIAPPPAPSPIQNGPIGGKPATLAGASSINPVAAGITGPQGVLPAPIPGMAHPPGTFAGAIPTTKPVASPPQMAGASAQVAPPVPATAPAATSLPAQAALGAPPPPPGIDPQAWARYQAKMAQATQIETRASFGLPGNTTGQATLMREQATTEIAPYLKAAEETAQQGQQQRMFTMPNGSKVFGTTANPPPGGMAENEAATKSAGEQASGEAKNFVDEEKNINDATEGRQTQIQAMERMQELMKGWQPGYFAENRQEIAAIAQDLGVDPSKIPGIKDNDAASAQEYQKDVTQAIFKAASALKGQIRVAELAGLAKAAASKNNTPQANAAIVTQTLGVLDYQNQYANDFNQALSSGTVKPQNFGQWKQNWIQNHNVQDSINKRLHDFGYLGQRLPKSADQAVDGQVYMFDNGKQGRWNAETKQFLPVGP